MSMYVYLGKIFFSSWVLTLVDTLYVNMMFTRQHSYCVLLDIFGCLRRKVVRKLLGTRHYFSRPICVDEKMSVRGRHGWQPQ
jgi:hypothetical protein